MNQNICYAKNAILKSYYYRMIENFMRIVDFIISNSLHNSKISNTIRIIDIKYSLLIAVGFVISLTIIIYNSQKDPQKNTIIFSCSTSNNKPFAMDASSN
jgi:hypothetical protein